MPPFFHSFLKDPFSRIKDFFKRKKEYRDCCDIPMRSRFSFYVHENGIRVVVKVFPLTLGFLLFSTSRLTDPFLLSPS